MKTTITILFLFLFLSTHLFPQQSDIPKSTASTDPPSVLRDTISADHPLAATFPKGSQDTTSLSFKDTDIREVFRALSRQHGINVFVENTVSKKITLSLNKVLVIDAMNFICEQSSLVLKIEGGVFKILNPPAPKPDPVVPKIPMVYFENDLLTVKLKNDDLETVILEIQNKTGKNILLSGGTTGTLSGYLNDVNFDIGFTQLMNNNGFAVQKRNNIYVVSRLDYYVGTPQGNQSQNQQRAGMYWVSVKDSVVTLDVTNAPLDRLLSDITRQLNTDIVYYNTISGAVTARATNVSLEKALDLIMRNTNFTYRVNDGIFFVGEKTNKALTVSRLIKLKYLCSDKILETIPQSLASQLVLKVIKEHNGVVAVGPGDAIVQLEEFMAQIDKPVAQVLIEAVVVDYDLSHQTDFGIQTGSLAASDSTLTSAGLFTPQTNVLMKGTEINKAFDWLGYANLGVLPSDFYVKLNAMQQKGLANVKSRPLLATLSGHPATLSIGKTQYYKLTTSTPISSSSTVYVQTSENFQTIEADTKLEITPYVGADRMITVEIKPDFKTPVGTLSSTTYPTINQRAMQSTLIMKEGETIVLGGLIEDTESETRTQVPLLGSIPIIGYLFSSTSKQNSKTELLIYVTPHISYGEAFQNVNIPSEDNNH
jgi:type IV pilus assembly protein PilQ